MLPIVSGKEVLKALLKHGFELKRQTGSHVHIIKHADGKTLHVTIPIHGNKDLNPFVIRSIIRQSGYSVEELVALLKE